jgi:hypothetical protein
MRNLTINGERLWASLMELARIGATAKGGVCRVAAKRGRTAPKAKIKASAIARSHASRSG